MAARDLLVNATLRDDVGLTAPVGATARLLGVGPPPPTGLRRWSDLTTWQELIGEARFPTLTDVVTVPSGHPGLLHDVDDGAVLDLHLHASFETAAGRIGRLRVARNFVQHHGMFRAIMPDGLFEMHWPSVDESTFVGGGMDVLDTDPGGWFMGAGLEIEGAVITPMAIAAVDLFPMQTEILLDRDPIGWQVGAKLAVAPMLPPTAANWTNAYDYPLIRSITGRLVSLDRALTFAHPRVGPFRDGTWEGAEVLYLGPRTVRFTGLPGKRPHLIVMAHPHAQPAPLVIRARYYETQWLGPQKVVDGNTIGQLGRYAGLHLHMLGEASRGALIEGALFHDAGNHCGVPHASHGTTWRDCWTHNVNSGAPWWTDRVFGGAGGAPSLWENMTHDTLLERCGASRVTYTPATRAQQLTAFSFNGGFGNQAIDCRAFGVGPGRLTSGALWPEGESGNPLAPDDFTAQSGVWKVVRMRVHSCEVGWKEWQNTSNNHGGIFGEDLVARIHNCKVANSRGAYGNIYKEQLEILACLQALDLHAQSRTRDGGMRYPDLYVDGQGIMQYAVQASPHASAPAIPITFQSPVFRNLRADGACFHLKNTDSDAGTASPEHVVSVGGRDIDETPLAPGSFFPDDWLVLAPDFGGNLEALVDADAHQSSKIELHLSGGQVLRVMRTLTPGLVNPDDDYVEPRWGAASVKVLVP